MKMVTKQMAIHVVTGAKEMNFSLTLTKCDYDNCLSYSVTNSAERLTRCSWCICVYMCVCVCVISCTADWEGLLEQTELAVRENEDRTLRDFQSENKRPRNSFFFFFTSEERIIYQ